MGYYLRVLSTSAVAVPLDVLRAALTRDGLTATLDLEEDGVGGGWTSLLLSNGRQARVATKTRRRLERSGSGGSLG